MAALNILQAISFVLFIRNKKSASVKKGVDELSAAEMDIDKLLIDDTQERLTMGQYFDEDDDIIQSDDIISIDDLDNLDELDEDIKMLGEDIDEKQTDDDIINLDIDILDDIQLPEDDDLQLDDLDMHSDDDIDDMKIFIDELEQYHKAKNDDDNALDDLLQSNISREDGNVLDERILKMEDDYFSSEDAFSFNDSDFLNIIDDENSPIIDDEDIDDNSSDDDIVEDISNNYIEEDIDGDEVPKIPDDYYTESEDDNLIDDDSNYDKKQEAILWDKLLDNMDFTDLIIDKSIDSIVNVIRDELSMNVDKALYLQYDSESNAYNVADNLDVMSPSMFNIKIDEAFYEKLLSKGNIVFIDEPMSSEILSSKFDIVEHNNINKLIFIPIINNESAMGKDYFVILKLSDL